MEDRVFSWGLTAVLFTLLLVFSTVHGAWWRGAASPLTRSHPLEQQVTPRRAATNPFAAVFEYVPEPAVRMATMPANSSGTTAPSDEEQLQLQSEGETIPEAYYEAMAQQRNRGVEHGSRTH